MQPVYTMLFFPYEISEQIMQKKVVYFTLFLAQRIHVNNVNKTVVNNSFIIIKVIQTCEKEGTH